jgi:urease accessory protein
VRSVTIAQTQADVFAANRATGHVALTAASAHGRTRRMRLHEDGSLRLRFPNVAAGAPLEAVLVNTGGGMTGGDRFSIDIRLGEGAHLLAGTAAAEKVYRSTGTDAELAVTFSLGAGANLAWLPQETILFDRARLNRRIDIDMADNASLVLCEAVVFGRSAMGETVDQGALRDRWRLRRGGRLVFAETVQLDGAIGARLAEPAVAAGAAAIATLLLVPGDEAVASAVRGLNDTFAGEVGVSAWNGLALVRFCARDGAALRHDIICVLAALRRSELPRLWLS